MFRDYKLILPVVWVSVMKIYISAGILSIVLVFSFFIHSARASIWTSNGNSSGLGHWQSITSSADGTHLAALGSDPSTGGGLEGIFLNQQMVVLLGPITAVHRVPALGVPLLPLLMDRILQQQRGVDMYGSPLTVEFLGLIIAGRQASILGVPSLLPPMVRAS